MESTSKIAFILIGLIIAIAVLFMGVEIGKHYSARNVVTSAVTSIDPFLYCELHEDNIIEGLLLEDFNSIEDMENYASSLYIKMSVTNKRYR